MQLADSSHEQHIYCALLELERYAQSYGWAKGVDFDHAYANVMQATNMGNAYVIDGYLVLVDEVTPWYSRERILQEWLVLKLSYGGSVSSIPPALLEIAAQRGCSLVMSGDSSPVNIVAEAYKAAGFSKLTTSFFKEVP